MEEALGLGMEVPIHPVVQVVTGVSCCLSLIGATCILFLYVRWPEFRNPPRQMLAFITLSDVIVTLCHLHGVIRNFQSNTWECIVQSFFSTFAGLSSVFWTVALMLYLFTVIVFTNRQLADRMTVYAHGVCWGVPALVVVIITSSRGLGYGGRAVTVGWCWINVQSHYFLLWMLLSAVILDIVCYIMLPLVSVLIQASLRTQSKIYSDLTPEQQHNLNYFTKVDCRLHWLPLVFVACHIWGTVRFFCYITHSSLISNQLLIALHGAASSIQAGINGLVFCFLTRHARNMLLPTLCCFVPPRNTELGSDDTPGGSTGQESQNLLQPIDKNLIY